jgi:two-component system CheB/CheR fusion protein
VRGTQHTCQITCYPQHADGEREPLDAVLIVITELADGAFGPQLAAAGERDEAASDQTPEERLARQERRITSLLETIRQLLGTNQELLSANEALRTANEEFVLSIEQAQASTEEVETLNEEMQATIEELNTTNDELHARTAELHVVVQESEEIRVRQRAILDTMGDALLVLSPAGAPLLSNPAYTRLFGEPSTPFGAEDAAGLPLPRPETPQGRALRGERFSVEFWSTTGDGERRSFEAVGRPILDPEGKLLWAILVIRDITGRGPVQQ